MNKFLLFVLLVSFGSISFVLAQYCTEGERQSCGSSNEGECSFGTQICTFGQWGICLGSVEPEAEVCDDGKDNDCDGEVDEHCECSVGEQRSCGTYNKGICHYGYELCVNGTWSGQCMNETKPQLNDFCSNNLDDDCDGFIDEGCAVKNQSSPATQQTCFNGVQDSGETGVDCGGSCRSCVSCTDGILNQGELKIAVDFGEGNSSDCGGNFCPACPSCFDGKKNQGEAAIDCGGPCRSCTSEIEDEDVDHDGLTDSVELQQGTDPAKADTDNDGIMDKQDRLPLCPNVFCDASYGEDETNCPDDCDSSTSFAFTLLLILGIIILFVGGYVYVQLHKGATKKTSDQSQGQRQSAFSYPYQLSSRSNSTRKSDVEQQLEKSLEKADQFLKKE